MHPPRNIYNHIDGGDTDTIQTDGDVRGIYGIPGIAVHRGFGDISNGAFCNGGGPALLFPGTRKRDCKKIFLAIDTGGDYIRGPGDCNDDVVVISDNCAPGIGRNTKQIKPPPNGRCLLHTRISASYIVS